MKKDVDVFRDNEKKLVRFFIGLTLLVIFSYFINFVWESFHSVFLFNLPNFSLREYVLLMNHVSSVDALMILGIYIITAFMLKDYLWINKLNNKKIWIFGGLCFAFALWVEYRGVFLLHKWSYSPLMPTIFGFGLSPIIQLFTTGLIAIFIIKKIVFK